MAGNSKTSPRKTTKVAAKSNSTPLRMIVRRGAVQRFKELKKKTAHLHVEVVWDQRDQERRQEPCLSDSERRARDRRRTPPFTWDVADFVVAPAKPQAAKKLRKR